MSRRANRVLETGSAPAPAARSLRERLLDAGDFPVIAEVVPWRGAIDDATGAKALATARVLADNPRVAALSITDNAGGRARLGPIALADEFVAGGHELIVHVACRDRSRSALESLAFELAGRGVRNVLAISGDYPVEGYEGLARPVFDLDSAALLRMYTDLGAELGRADPPHPGFFLGAAVNNHKRRESELIPQYLKLELKVRSGAGFVISQVGYDALKQDELLRYMRLRGLDVPAVANVYILGRVVARLFQSGEIPGCVVTDDLLRLVEEHAASPDKGRAFFLELAARQVAVARGLGYAAVYLSGHRNAGEVERVLAMADAYAPDWRALARGVTFPQPGEFHYFEEDQETGLSTDEVNRAYRRSLTTRARRRARRRVPIGYRFSRLIHWAAFTPGERGFGVGTRVFQTIETLPQVKRPVHALEQAVKVPLYDCRDCGDCSLPEIAYLCPESQCVKNQRNGPCGGTKDGRCEAAQRDCVWSRAYERLKPYGEELAMLDRRPVVQDNKLRRTSAWASTFMGRDHSARRTRRGEG
jgi:methylenetetrahydrofolate reductase (NADH)